MADYGAFAPSYGDNDSGDYVVGDFKYGNMGDYPNVDASDLYNDDDGVPDYRDLSNMHAHQMKSRPQPITSGSMLDEEDEDNEELQLQAKLASYQYNPDDYADINAPPSISALFSLITAHIPEEIEIPTKLRPFIPDYIPSVGGVDNFLKIPRPDGKPEVAGLLYLDEPSLSQSDPTALELRLRRTARKAGLGDTSVRSIPEADKNPAKVTAWLAEMRKATVDRGASAAVSYTRPMPSVEQLVRVWPAEFEKVLDEVCARFCHPYIPT
jgi:intraflagellar transport protein 46